MKITLANSKKLENNFFIYKNHLMLTLTFSHLSYFIYSPKLFDVITCKQVFVPLPLVTDAF